MLDRLPLSVVLDGPGQRHRVPHRTYSAPVDSAFFKYLDSDDTRLPRHPYLDAYQQPAEEYETYVGEDVWKEQQQQQKADDEVSPPPPTRFDDVVDWVVEVLHEDWAQDGVVLCGAYAMADDCTWAVPSRSISLAVPREVFMVMRNSSKFLKDVHLQIVRATAVANGSSYVGTQKLSFTLAKAIGGEGAREWRVFIPYLVPLYRATSVINNTAAAAAAAAAPFSATALEPTASALHPLYNFAGVCQRATDVCFPSLMAWTEDEHHQHYKAIVSRVQDMAILERTCRVDPCFLPRLVSRFKATRRQPVAEEAVRDSSVALVSVDVIFESLSLPIQVLSAKVRLFERDVREEEGNEGVPFLVVPPSEEADEAHQPDVAAATTTTEDASPFGSELRNARDSSSERDDGADGDADEEEDEEEEDITTFLRLFRDEFNWNHYMEVMKSRVREGGRRFCVVASEQSDLVTCRDTFTKRGLPLELMNSEFLCDNPEALEFLKRFREAACSKHE